MAKTAKRMKNAYEGIDREKRYTLSEAVDILVKAAKDNGTKFDQSVELAVNLNIDPRQADQNLRGMYTPPHGTGKSKTVAVLCNEAKLDEAKSAGADLIGDDVIAKIESGEFGFDVLIATPDQMAVLGRHGRALGPKGLMPNPKLGTVTMDITDKIKEMKAGAVEYRAEKNGIIHVPMGKVSFDAKKLTENISGMIKLLQKLKPSSVKGIYMQRVAISSTMGPGIKVDPSSVE